MLVSVVCRDTGELLLKGELLVENEHCVSVEKQYPNGQTGGVTFLKNDVYITPKA